jgi:DNA-binding CsgD family transcriptional regulator
MPLPEEAMSTQVVFESRGRDTGDSLFATLTASDTPALATDAGGRIVFWNRAAERALDRSANLSLGHRCHEVLAGRDVHENRYCHEGCTVFNMVRRGETVHGFELLLGSAPRAEQAFHVTILKVAGERPMDYRLVHILEPIDRAGRLARALEGMGMGSHPAAAPAPATETRHAASEPPLTEREQEILRFAATGLQNKEIADKLGISVATVRNHVHNLLDKLEVHSKLEAVSLAFRKGWVSGGPAQPADGIARVEAWRRRP